MFKINFYRQLKGFFTTSFKSQLRTSSSIFIGFIFPIIFIVTFGYFSTDTGQEIDVGVVTNDTFNHELRFVDELRNTNLFVITRGSEQDLKEQIESGEIDGIVELLEENQVVVTTNRNQPEESNIIVQGVKSVVDKITVQSNDLFILYNLEQQTVAVTETEYMDFILPGLVGFSLLSSAISGTAFSFLALRRNNVLKRLFAAPASSAAFIIGQALARSVFIFFQSMALIAIAYIVFNYSPTNGADGFWQMLPIILLGLIVFLGLGYIIAGMAKSSEAASPIANILIFSQFLLAGTIFPVSNLPGWLQTVSQVLPLYNFNEALRLVSLQGLNLWSTPVLLQLGILTGWGLLFYVIASQVFRVRY
jgi:ABC-2 type transport system permease protein